MKVLFTTFLFLILFFSTVSFAEYDFARQADITIQECPPSTLMAQIKVFT